MFCLLIYFDAGLSANELKSNGNGDATVVTSERKFMCEVEPLFVQDQVFTQLSDHYAIALTLDMEDFK